MLHQLTTTATSGAQRCSGQVEFVGDDVDDDLSHDIAAEKMEMARHAVNELNLDEILYRRSQWQQVLKSKKEQTGLQISLQKLTDLVTATGGVPQRCPWDSPASSETLVKVVACCRFEFRYCEYTYIYIYVYNLLWC